ncbi:hypothetical protein D3C76_1211160 [compost metagenome]
MSLAGVHYPDTTEFFCNAGIVDVTLVLKRLGWPVGGRDVFIADHYRAAVDMLIRWVLSESQHCNVELAEWFPGDDDKLRLLELLYAGRLKLRELGRLGKVEIWLHTQLGLRGAD